MLPAFGLLRVDAAEWETAMLGPAESRMGVNRMFSWVRSTKQHGKELQG